MLHPSEKHFQAETKLWVMNAIRHGLDGFLDEFEPKFKSVSLSNFRAVLHSDEGNFALIHSLIRLTESKAQYVVGRSIFLLSSLPVAVGLSSRHPPKPLKYDFATFIDSWLLKVESIALLLERVINHSPDHDPWHAARNLTTPATPPLR